MRTVKFRAYDTLRKEYLSAGNIFLSISDGSYPNDGAVYLDVLTEPNKYSNRFIIEEFSGLYDRDGKDIYEGDILWWNRDSKTYLVKFVDGMFYASIIDHKKRILGGYPLHVLTEHKEEWECEIIGNSFENKELLNK